MNITNYNSPYYLIAGGIPLRGEVSISGAKNAVTKLIIASLLTIERGCEKLDEKLKKMLGAQIECVE